MINYKKDRSVCKNCYNKIKRKILNNILIQNETTISHQQSKNVKCTVNNNNNNRTLLVGPSLSGKTYLMFKILPGIPYHSEIII